MPGKLDKSRKYLLAIAAVIPFLVLGLHLVMKAEEKPDSGMRLTIGVISLVFWTGILLWASWAFFRSQKKISNSESTSKTEDINTAA